MYADDLQLYTSTFFHDLSKTLNLSKTLTELNTLTTIMETHFKTECVIIHNHRQISPTIHITIANEPILIKQAIITLGVTLDSTVWSPH